MLKNSPLTAEGRKHWSRDGYLVLRGLLSSEEVAEIKANFDDFAATPEVVPDHWHPADDATAAGDPLKRYPRVMHPHAFMPMAMRYMLDDRIRLVLTELLNDEPIATQSMFYFKPTGAKGQALHQDNYYLRVHPHTCIAAWCAIDPSLPENGGMTVVPGTHELDIACPQLGDALPEHVRRDSFTTDYVPPPEGKQAVPCLMEPGDVLFFNGSVIHGSTPNTHPTLWRRSLIFHYMPSAATEISHYYQKFGLWSFDGSRVDRDSSPIDGGPCGTEADATVVGMA